MRRRFFHMAKRAVAPLLVVVVATGLVIVAGGELPKSQGN